MKHVIQVTSTDDKDLTAEIHFVTAFIQQFSNGGGDYPWFVKGKNTLFSTDRGTVFGD